MQKNSKLAYLILAAGNGSRLKSNLAKGLHVVAGKPILEHLVSTLEGRKDGDIFIVVKTHQEQIREHFGSRVTYVEQEQPLGTGHAVLSALSEIQSYDRIIILLGDMPFLSSSSIEKLIQEHSKSIVAMTVLTANINNPQGYGRILRNENGVLGIVEEKDASEEQRKIKEVNTGVMLVECAHLKSYLPKIQPNNVQHEYYLIDLVFLLIKDNHRVFSTHAICEEETRGINTMQDLLYLERWYQLVKAEELMSQGVHLIDARRLDLRGEIKCENDVVIDVNVIIENVSLGSNVRIGANTILKNCQIESSAIIGSNVILRNCKIGSNTEIKDFCLIDGSPEKSSHDEKICHINIGASCQIGPYARIRPESIVEDNAHIGNFVELKKASVGLGSKVNHLSYIGDARIGEKTNIGAGTITCNFDGKNKYKTNIGNNVFIGSNVALVAPIELNNDVYIAAGSTITQPVDQGLAVARSKQCNKPNWKPDN